jgi:hypothetical protein
MNLLLNRIRQPSHGYSGKAQDAHDKRKFPRFAVEKEVVCFRYGKKMTMRTVNISLGGLKLQANFDLWVGESMDFSILTNGTRIQCKGRVLAIEEFKNKVHARLRFAHTSDLDFRKLSQYMNTLSRGKAMPIQKWIIGASCILTAYIAYLIIRTYFFQ